MFSEQKEFKLGETTYILTAFPAMTGLEVQMDLIAAAQSGFPYTPDLMFKVISKGATIGSATIDKKKFDSHFRKKYGEMLELYTEVLKFNELFPETEEEDSPNVKGDTSES